MGSKLIDDIIQFTSSDSLLVHTKKNGLMRLYCPFTVKVVQSVDTFVMGQQVEVVRIKISSSLKLIYVINGKGYYHYQFSIQV